MKLAEQVIGLLVEGGVPREAITIGPIRKGLILTVNDKGLCIPTIIPDAPSPVPQWSADALAEDILNLWRHGPPTHE